MSDLIERWGFKWKGHDNGTHERMADGYWTPWHLAAASLAAQDAETQHWFSLANTRAIMLIDKDAEIEKLKTAIRMQAADVRTLEANKSTELNVLRAKAQGEYAATRTLDSEKDMNAILTAEIEAKDAEIARLREALRDIAGNGDPDFPSYSQTVAKSALATDQIETSGYADCEGGHD